MLAACFKCNKSLNKIFSSSDDIKVESDQFRKCQYIDLCVRVKYINYFFNTCKLALSNSGESNIKQTKQSLHQGVLFRFVQALVQLEQKTEPTYMY